MCIRDSFQTWLDSNWMLDMVQNTYWNYNYIPIFIDGPNLNASNGAAIYEADRYFGNMLVFVMVIDDDAYDRFRWRFTETNNTISQSDEVVWHTSLILLQEGVNKFLFDPSQLKFISAESTGGIRITNQTNSLWKPHVIIIPIERTEIS